jgi:hypothetical protein
MRAPRQRARRPRLARAVAAAQVRDQLLQVGVGAHDWTNGPTGAAEGWSARLTSTLLFLG